MTITPDTKDWTGVLAGEGVHLRQDPEVWSPLEYGCHVRDVFRIGTFRLQLLLDRDEPTFPNWDQDATAEEDDYAARDPTTVAREIVDSAEVTAAVIDGLEPSRRDRAGHRSDGARFTVEGFARYLLHDPVHHLHDVGAPFIADRSP